MKVPVKPTMYLASPPDPLFASACAGVPVLLCFSSTKDWMLSFQATFEKVLIDSGAYSEFHTGKKVDIEKYKDWSQRWIGFAEAIAGLDDISGDYKRSFENYAKVPWGFPTWHIRDPIEIIPDLVALAYERGKWLGMSCKEKGHEVTLRKALEMIPDDIHIHGWAMRQYAFLRRFDSFDSTSWWRNAMVLRGSMKWLHLGECVEIIIKKYQREARMFDLKADSGQLSLFDLTNEVEEIK